MCHLYVKYIYNSGLESYQGMNKAKLCVSISDLVFYSMPSYLQGSKKKTCTDWKVKEELGKCLVSRIRFKVRILAVGDLIDTFACHANFVPVSLLILTLWFKK